MRKLFNSIKGRSKPPKPEASSVGRITNETVAEHRERILAGGRRFKYPHQYPKHWIVLITTLIVTLSVISFFIISLWQLYSAQNSGEFMYRLTQIIPFPVAKVEDQWVPYSDYLLELRSALHYLATKESVNFSSDDGKRQLEYQKRLALNKSIENSFVIKIAKEQNISIGDQELNEFVNRQITTNRLGVSLDVYKQVIRDYYDWSFDEYKQSVKKQLLHKRVVAKIDTEGRQKASSTLAQLRQGASFADIAKQQSEDPAAKSNAGDIGFVAKTTEDPNGLVQAALKLSPGQTSDIIEGVDGFYIVKLIETKDNNLHIAKIFIAYKTFAKQLSDLKKGTDIKEYIRVADVVKPTNR